MDKTADLENLKRLNKFVSPLTGIIKYIYGVENFASDAQIFNFATKVADSQKLFAYANYQNNGGAGLNLEKARLSAIGESLERYCSAFCSKKNLRCAAYSDLTEPALDPEQLHFYSARQYASPEFPFRPLTREDKTYWIWGFSMLRRQPLLVPAALAYVPYFFEGEEPRFCLSTSSGMAFGGALAQAILSGIYELVERDAVMLTWLNKLSLPKVDLGSLPFEVDRVLTRQFKYLKEKLSVIDVTTDFGIPAYFSIFEGDNPRAAVGAAANLDPQKAFLKSVVEAAQTRIWAGYLSQKHRGHKFKDDFSDITRFDQHVFLYSQAEMFPHFEFLLQSNKKVPLRAQIQIDASKELAVCLEILKTRVEEAIYVDLTTPEVAEEGFFAVKVIIPELIPLFAGTLALPLGLKRLYAAPKHCGWMEKGKDEAEINRLPHPFP